MSGTNDLIASTMDRGEQHYGIPPPDRTIESLTDARLCFAHADTMLRESSNYDPSLNIRVYFRLMTVEYDLSHDKACIIDERITHIRRARENGSKAFANAFISQKATHMAQVKLEKAFIEGRMAELKEQKGKTSGGAIHKMKGKVLRDMDDAMEALRCFDEKKSGEYLKRVAEWKVRLIPEN